ncbi:MAG: hypothetical protein WCA00_10010 [Candidatus Acidiferrales bacterium]
MSRDAFSHDPQDPREPSTSRSLRRHRSFPPSAPDDQKARTETNPPRERTDIRELANPRDAQSSPERDYYVRDRAYRLRDSEIRSMTEIGKFRMIRAHDLVRYAYDGDRERMERDLRHLKREALLSEKTLEISQKKTLRVVTLTKLGHRLLRRTNQLPEDQAIYHGLLKSREAEHDADLYRLYQKEAARIERAGGRPVRVILDYEIKRNLNRDLALLGAEKDDLERKAEVAKKHGLQVVNGKIPVPDLRVEYEDAELVLQRVDLELATREYRPRSLAEKTKAGFAIYGRVEDAPRLRRILDERELTREIFTL